MSPNISYQISPPDQILKDLGRRLSSVRLARNITQKQLAERAGISERTLKRMEAGEGATVDTLVRVLQALNLADNLRVLLPEPGLQPVMRSDLAGKDRQRARPKSKSEPTPWTWGDEGDA